MALRRPWVRVSLTLDVGSRLSRLGPLGNRHLGSGGSQMVVADTVGARLELSPAPLRPLLV